jgi:hypothetical protein
MQNVLQFEPRSYYLPSRQINLLHRMRQGGDRTIARPQEVLASSTDFVECRRAVRGLGAKNHGRAFDQLEAFSRRVGFAEKKMWKDIHGCDRQRANQAAKLAKERWFALAAYLSARTLVAKMKPGENPAELFNEFSRAADEMRKCTILTNFVLKHAKRLEVGRYDGKIFVPKIFEISPGQLLFGAFRCVEEREDALQAILRYLDIYSSPERYRTSLREVSPDTAFVTEILTRAGDKGTSWGGFKLFTDLVVDYFGSPVSDKEKTPAECKRLEWVDSLARVPGQPLFFKKLPGGAQQYAVIRPHGGAKWGYSDTERTKNSKAQTVVCYYVPANPARIAPVSTGLGGMLRDQFGITGEKIGTIVKQQISK